MPEIEGQEFPPYEFHEYPKALYPQGQALDGDGNARRPVIANDAEHEEELKAEHADLGLAPIAPPEPTEHEEEPVEELPPEPPTPVEEPPVVQPEGAEEASAAGDPPSAAE